MTPFYNITKEHLEKTIEDVFSNNIVTSPRKFKGFMWFSNKKAKQKFFKEFNDAVKDHILNGEISGLYSNIPMTNITTKTYPSIFTSN